MAALGVLLLAAVLRLWGLPATPAGFNQDEAVAAYDAYSIWHTGRDHHGARFPLVFQAFNDWIPPVHTYAAVPFAALLGPGRAAVRLLSAMAGTATVLGTYALGASLMGRRVGLVAALLLAVSPWHLAYSGIGHPAIMLPLLTTWGMACAAIALHCRSVGGRVRAGALTAAGVVLALATFSYPVGKLFIPTLCAAAAVVYRRELLRPHFAVALMVAVAPFAVRQVLDWDDIQSRFVPLSVAGADRPALTFLRNYWLHFWPPQLFWHGFLDGLMAHPPGIRQLPLVEAPLFLVGVGVLAGGWRARQFQLLAAWLLLYPIASSLTYPQVPHEIRSATGFPALQLASALGAVTLLRLRMVRRFIGRSATAAVLALGITVNAAVTVDWWLRAGPARGTDADGKFRVGVMEALEYLRGNAPSAYDTLWFPHQMESYFRVLYLAHMRIPPAAQPVGGVPALRPGTPPTGLPPGCCAAWLSDQPGVAPPPGWVVRRRVIGTRGETVATVLTSPDLPAPTRDVVRVQTAPADRVEVVQLSALVLVASVAACRLGVSVPREDGLRAQLQEHGYDAD